mmetsp:Transcript_34490/g.98517  ORF Transcript_34490/g.98517 Transcript_34490/m.98517 type:complete len:306 (+) Transcript_34490:343-1260(+)
MTVSVTVLSKQWVAATRMCRLECVRGNAPDFVRASTRSNAAPFSLACASPWSVEVLGLASNPFWVRLVHVLAGLMMVGRSVPSVSSLSKRSSISRGTCVKSRAPPAAAPPVAALSCAGARAGPSCAEACGGASCADSRAGAGAAGTSAVAAPNTHFRPSAMPFFGSFLSIGAQAELGGPLPPIGSPLPLLLPCVPSSPGAKCPWPPKAKGLEYSASCLRPSISSSLACSIISLIAFTWPRTASSRSATVAPTISVFPSPPVASKERRSLGIWYLMKSCIRSWVSLISLVRLSSARFRTFSSCGLI